MTPGRYLLATAADSPPGRYRPAARGSEEHVQRASERCDRRPAPRLRRRRLVDNWRMDIGIYHPPASRREFTATTIVTPTCSELRRQVRLRITVQLLNRFNLITCLCAILGIRVQGWTRRPSSELPAGDDGRLAAGGRGDVGRIADCRGSGHRLRAASLRRGNPERSRLSLPGARSRTTARQAAWCLLSPGGLRWSIGAASDEVRTAVTSAVSRSLRPTR